MQGTIYNCSWNCFTKSAIVRMWGCCFFQIFWFQEYESEVQNREREIITWTLNNEDDPCLSVLQKFLHEFNLRTIFCCYNLLAICCLIINLACTLPSQHGDEFFNTIASKLKSTASPKLQGDLKLPQFLDDKGKYVFAFSFCTYFLYQLGIILIVYSF